MEVHMDSPKYKSTKSAKKYVKVQKYCMEVHIWTVQPSDKVQKYKKQKSTKQYRNTKTKKAKNAKTTNLKT